MCNAPTRTCNHCEYHAALKTEHPDRRKKRTAPPAPRAYDAWLDYAAKVAAVHRPALAKYRLSSDPCEQLATMDDWSILNYDLMFALPDEEGDAVLDPAVADRVLQFYMTRLRRLAVPALGARILDPGFVEAWRALSPAEVSASFDDVMIALAARVPVPDRTPWGDYSNRLRATATHDVVSILEELDAAELAAFDAKFREYPSAWVERIGLRPAVRLVADTVKGSAPSKVECLEAVAAAAISSFIERLRKPFMGDVVDFAGVCDSKIPSLSWSHLSEIVGNKRRRTCT